MSLQLRSIERERVTRRECFRQWTFLRDRTYARQCVSDILLLSFDTREINKESDTVISVEGSINKRHFGNDENRNFHANENVSLQKLFRLIFT